MNQSERRKFLINYLLDGQKAALPQSEYEERRMLRSLVNVRPASPVSEDFLRVESEYLKEELALRGAVDISDLVPVEGDLYIWQGDITRLSADAIVNAANSGMTGCYVPCHSCIDNCIHTFAGVMLRNKCAEIMRAQGHDEPTGGAKITPGYNLPAKYVIHTVGPIVSGMLNDTHRSLLRSCYESCLKIADEYGCKSIAFCCISTGVFMFPNDEAARIAVDTVKNYKSETKSEIKVIFNVFKDEDLYIYSKYVRATGE